MKGKHLSSVLPQHQKAITRLIEDPAIKGSLAWDINLKVSDKNLLAMVIACFSWAGLFPWPYQRIRFFPALYLAHHTEEDSQEPKLHRPFFLCGMTFGKISQIYKLCYQFIRGMDWDLHSGGGAEIAPSFWDPGALWTSTSGLTVARGAIKQNHLSLLPRAGEPMMGPWGTSPPPAPSLP
ncbi:Speedy protein B [Fukomys damarensis]|uniref:Speedy protein B n=1 Tax=Fukomys damarensis TaxID=885580 RepID=A0A091DCW2_FUKDA|nr:Speedy protein B [Fukomys damarensis]